MHVIVHAYPVYTYNYIIMKFEEGLNTKVKLGIYV